MLSFLSVPVQNINVYVGYLYILGNGPILEIPVPVQNANVYGVCLIHSASELARGRKILPGAEKKNAGSLNYILDLCSWDIVI